MSRREATLVGWFTAFVGAVALLMSLYGVVVVAAPTNSLTRTALIEWLVAVIGISGGRVVYHLIYALGGAFLLWVGVKILQERSP